MSTQTKKAFTIVELLTVMSIVVILMGILVPAMNRVRRYAKIVTQKGQFHEISKGLELYHNEHQDTYPDSGPVSQDTAGAGAVTVGYCGAMKMCEALMGQDGMGFHPSSRFTADGTGLEPNGATIDLYPFDLCASIDPSVYSGPAATKPWLATNLQARIKYVDVENFKANRLQDLYKWNVSGGVSYSAYDNLPFKDAPDTFPNSTIGDVFQRATIQTAWCSQRAGQKAGMPVLYYKADPSKQVHDVNTIWVPNPNVYNFDDNYAITMLGCPWESLMNVNPHPMYLDPKLFYKNTINTKITATPKPHNEDGYILISAGWDGLYGTKDDVFNFTE
jgi:prepilin-type N-terminal cleavage/methylation domain-containing protein